MSRTVSIAVINTTDMVAEVLLERMSDYVGNWNARVSLFDSAIAEIDADGEIDNTALFNGKSTLVQHLSEIDFSLLDLVFVCGEVEDALLQSAKQQSCRIIDLRRNAHPVAVAVAGVNEKSVGSEAYLASPHPVTVCIAPIIDVLAELAVVSSFDVAAMMPASEAGNAGIKALAAQTARLLNGQPIANDVFGTQLAFNVVAPALGDVITQQNRIVADLRTVCCNPDLQGRVLLVTVPVFFGMTLAVDIHFASPVSSGDAAKALRKLRETTVASGKKRLPSVVDSAAGETRMHLALLPVEGTSASAASSLLRLWLVADNIHRGRVFNALALADYLISHPA